MRRGAVIGVVAGAAALIVVIAGIGIWLSHRAPSAEAVAEDYLRALSEGDLAAVDALVAGGIKDPAGATAFEGASAYISDYSYELGATGSDPRSVHAEVELAGGPATVDFDLVQQDDGWKVGPGYLATLTVETSIGDSVRVGGVLVPAAEPMPLLPAAYDVTAAPAELLTGQATAVVTNESPVTVTVDATVSAAATARAQEELDAYADACAQPATAVPDNCGLRVPWAADLGTLSSIAFRIDAHPAITLDGDGRSFAATGGDIVATATGTTRDGTPATFTYRADDWALRGDVTFTGDEMVLAVR